LLLALFADEESVAAKVLRELGVESERCRELVVAKLSGFTKPGA
jgi:DNA-directed RNA polymerase subunit N (RpoN/RPB10)